MELKTEVKSENEKLTIMFSGPLTEKANFLIPEEHEWTECMIIDLSKVTRINSVGVRAWMNFLQRIKDAGKVVVFEKVSFTCINQLAMVKSFLADFEIASFYVPYFCSNCGEEFQELFSRSQNVPEALDCPSCKSLAEIDEDVAVYETIKNRTM